MSHPLKVVTVSGSPSVPSKTSVLVETIAAQLGRRRKLQVESLEIAKLVTHLGSTTSLKDSHPDVRASVKAIESADLLIVGTPVYRGSYTGLFKHLFDLVHHEALFNVPVLLAASGGSDRHALVIDHQLRPLFSFFQSLTLPIGVYATDADFTDYRISSQPLLDRIDLAVDRALPWLATSSVPLSQAA